LNVCMCHTAGISPTVGGGIASVISDVINETKHEVNYTLITTFNERDLNDARLIYDSTIRIVSLKPSNNPVLNYLMYLLKAPTKGFDIVHFHGLPFGRSSPYALKLHLKGLSLILSHHYKMENTRYFPFNHRIGIEYYQLSFNRLSKIWRRIIVSSKFMLRDLERYSNCLSKGVVVPNGVNIEKIQKSQPFSLTGNPSFLFLGHPIHNCLAIMNFADFMGNASIKKHPFSNGSFSSINVSNHSDISYSFYWINSWHKIYQAK